MASSPQSNTIRIIYSRFFLQFPIIQVIKPFCFSKEVRKNECMLGKVRFFLGAWGRRAGASEGRVISESEHQRGRAIPSFSAIQGEGHTFSRIFNEDFCDIIFHFSLTD